MPKIQLPPGLPKNFLKQIYKYPHKLGHLVGKDKLTEMHSEWIHYIWDTENVPDLNGELNNHRSLQAHRGAYKTTAITEIGCMWWLLFHPNDRINLIRKPYEEAAKTLWTIKQYMETEAIQAVFYAAHGIPLQKKVNKENSVTWTFKKTITKEGNLDISSIETVKTGSHYDKILCDDIVTRKDRLSKAEREKTIGGVQEILTNIIDPGKQAGFVGTPWHKDDAHKVSPPAVKFIPSDTNILSEKELADKRKTTTETLFNINYLLKHTSDEECPFNDPKYDKWDYKCKTYAHIDAKFGGDHFGALTMAAFRPNGDIQVFGYSFTDNVKHKKDWINERYKKHRAKVIHIEENPDKGYTGDLLRDEGMIVDSYHEDMNKDHKIEHFISYFWEKIFFDPDTDDDYMGMITDWKTGEEPNDSPDSLASILRRVFYKQNVNKSLWEA
jgi:hypothetical protein